MPYEIQSCGDISAAKAARAEKQAAAEKAAKTAPVTDTKADAPAAKGK